MTSMGLLYSYDSETQNLLFNWQLLGALLLIILSVDLLNTEPQLGYALPMAVRLVILYGLFLFTVMMIFIDVQKGLATAIVIYISQNRLPLFSYDTFTSIYVVKPLPFLDLGDMVLVALLLSVSISSLRRQQIILPNTRILRYLTVIFIGVVLATAWGAVRYGSIMYLLRDLQVYIYMFGFFAVGILSDLSEERIYDILWLVVFAAGFKGLIYSLKFVLHIGRPYGGTIRVIFGGEPHLFLLGLFTFATVLIYHCSPETTFSVQYPGFLLVPTGGCLLFLFVNPSRLTWLVTGVLLVVYFYFLRVSRERKAIVLIVGVFCLAIAGILIKMVYPGVIRHILYAIGTLVDPSSWSVQFKSEGASLSGRVAEFVNILLKLQSNSTYLVGEGLGSWWKEVYLDIPAKQTSASEVVGGYAAGEERHRSTHFPLSYTLLKFGILGTIVYWSIWGAVVWDVKRYATRLGTFGETIIFPMAISFPALLATRFLKYRLVLMLCLGLILQVVLRSYTSKQ